MAKDKSAKAASGAKKRKADTGEIAGDSSKKARREQPTAFVQLPHSPGGRKHAKPTVEPKTNDSDDDDDEGDHTQGPSTSQAPRLKKQTRRRKNVQERKREEASLVGIVVEPAAQPRDDVEGGAKRRKRGKKKSRSEKRIAEELKAAKVSKSNTEQKQSGPESEADRDDAELESEPEDESDDGGEAEKAEAKDPKQAVEAFEKQLRRERKKAARAATRLEDESVVTTEAEKPTHKLRRQSLEKAPVDDLDVGGAKGRDHQPDWSLSAQTAGRFIDHDPIFVRHPDTNEEFLITATGGEVQLLSVETSLPIRSCTATNGQTVQCFSLIAINGDNISIAYSDGSMARWDWASDAPPRSMPHAKGLPQALAWMTGPEEDEDEMFHLSDMGAHTAILRGDQSLYYGPQKLRSLQVLGDREYVVAHSPKALVLGTKKDKKSADSGFAWVEIPMSTNVTCVHARLASSANADKRDTKRRSTLSLAVGNTQGQIHLYEDIASVFAQKGQATLPSPRILHWHRDAVSAAKFSQDGNYLISGGKETVLVLWQLETGRKQFLPHLTSEIERIVVSPEGDKYAVQMGDNSIMVLSTSELKPVANFAGLQLASATHDVSRKAPADEADAVKKSVAAVLHPSNANHLLLAVPATQPKSHDEAAEARSFLQTFDLRRSRHITRQALTRNNVTDFNLGPENTPIAPPDVTHLAVSCDGQWLASVDEWEPPTSDLEHLVRDGGMQLNEERRKRREAHLKIWRWDEGQGLWTLSTRVDAPHARAVKGAQGAGDVFSLTADPASTGFATIGEDSCVRIWKPRARVRHGVVVKGEDDVEVVEWICRRTVELPTYTERADSPMEYTETQGRRRACLAYSADGSLIAVSQTFDGTDEQPLVHFIDTASGEIKISKFGVAAAGLEHVGFLDRYFIAVSRGVAHVWDLVTDKLHQRHDIPKIGTPALAINHTDGTFAIIARTKISIYKPSEMQPIYLADCGSTIAAVLAGKGSRGYTLLFEDATVRTLATIGAAHRRALPPPEEQVATAATDASSPAQSVIDEAAAEDVEMTEVLALPATEEQELGPSLLDDAEDDRPVVRPEQLANIFDVGPSFAMPPVKDMFEAVVALYGRKPLASRVGEVAA